MPSDELSFFPPGSQNRRAASNAWRRAHGEACVCVCVRERERAIPPCVCRQLRDEATTDMGTHHPHVVQSHGILRPEGMPRPRSADGLVDVLRDG